MNYIGAYRVIKSYKPRGSTTTLYVLEHVDTHKTIEIYYCTFKRLINGQTTIKKILDWHSSRKRNKSKVDLSLYHNLKMPYGYRFKNKKIVIKKDEAETVQYIFYCFDRLHYTINKISKLVNMSYTKTQNIINNREFYKGCKHLPIIYQKSDLTAQEMLFRLYHGINSKKYYSKLKKVLGLNFFSK